MQQICNDSALDSLLARQPPWPWRRSKAGNLTTKLSDGRWLTVYEPKDGIGWRYIATDGVERHHSRRFASERQALEAATEVFLEED